MRIGEFARLTRVSVKTLQHYDEIGLLKPARVDRFTGYRYYEHDQYAVVSRIRALKDLGFSLDEIARVIDAGLSNEQLQAMLRMRVAEIRGRLSEEHDRLARAEAWLAHLKRKNPMTDYEVIVKRVDSMKVASLRGTVEAPPRQSDLWCKVFDYLNAEQAEIEGPCLTLYYNEEPPEKDWDVEVCAPITSDLPVGNGIDVKTLPEVPAMATVVHSGPFMNIDDAYASLNTWLQSNGYKAAGPYREVVIRAPALDGDTASQTDPSTVVKLQVPLDK